MHSDESYPDLGYRTFAITSALDELGVRPDDRILIMLPDGPGFAEIFADVTRRGAVALPVNPLLPVHDVTTVADEAGARLLLASADRIQALAALDAEPPVQVSGPQGVWAAVYRLR